MEPPAEPTVIPSISSGSVGSRFVTQGDLDTAKARRDEQWKAAYARLGQEPPPQPKEDAFDGRSLAEKLAANKAAKQDEWEERNRLANQFRALEADEVQFLDSVRERELEEEFERKKAESVELNQFKAAVAARESAAAAKPPPVPLTPVETVAVPAAKPKPTSAPKPTALKKKSLTGVVVKKKKTPVGAAKLSTATAKETTAAVAVADKEKDTKSAGKDDEDEERSAKRRKV